MKSFLLPFLAVTLGFATTSNAGTVYFEGEISKCTMHQLVSRVEKLARQGDTNITIMIDDSDGGDLYATIEANKKLRQYNVNTHVQGTCASSCTALYSVGRTRTASSGAKFMFHAAKVGNQLISKKTAAAISVDPCQPQAVHVTYGQTLTEEQRIGFRNKFATDWLKEISQASPSLAYNLERKSALSESERDEWVSLKFARGHGFVSQ